MYLSLFIMKGIITIEKIEVLLNFLFFFLKGVCISFSPLIYLSFSNKILDKTFLLYTLKKKKKKFTDSLFFFFFFLPRRYTGRFGRTRTWPRTPCSAWPSWPPCMAPSFPMRAPRSLTWHTWWRACSAWSMGQSRTVLVAQNSSHFCSHSHTRCTCWSVSSNAVGWADLLCPEWNIFTTVEWDAIKFCTCIQILQMNRFINQFYASVDKTKLERMSTWSPGQTD